MALPVDCIGAFLRRPLSTISRSEYMRLARDLATQAKSIKVSTVNFTVTVVLRRLQ